MDQELQVTVDAMRRADSRGAGRFERRRGSRARTTSRAGSDVTQYEISSSSDHAPDQYPSIISPVTQEWFAKGGWRGRMDYYQMADCTGEALMTEQVLGRPGA